MTLSVQDTLVERVLRFAPRQGANATCVSGLQLYRFDRRNEPSYALYEPSVCFIVQGGKRVLIGDQVLNYGHMRHRGGSGCPNTELVSISGALRV